MRYLNILWTGLKLINNCGFRIVDFGLIYVTEFKSAIKNPQSEIVIWNSELHFLLNRHRIRSPTTIRVMFIGSCFASSIGSQMEMGHMPVMINPAGAVFNPVSVCNTLDTITNQERNLIWMIFIFTMEPGLVSIITLIFHLTIPAKLLEKINRKSKEAFDFLKNASFLFITLGTARVYRWKKTGLIVSNCHKIPSDQFESGTADSR